MISIQSFDVREFIKAFGQGLVAVLILLVLLAFTSWWVYPSQQDPTASIIPGQTILLEPDKEEKPPAASSENKGTDPSSSITHPDFSEIVISGNPDGAEINPPPAPATKDPKREREKFRPQWSTKLYKSELTEPSAFGPLPIRDRRQNLTPYQAYRIPFNATGDQRLISIVILIEHLDPAMAERIISQLPPYITLAFSPYFDNPDPLVKLAKDSGHEVWLTLPLESRDPLRHDSGPLTLRRDFSFTKNSSILLQLMARLKGYTGLLSPLKENLTLTVNSPRVEKLFTDMFERGLAVAYTNPIIHESLQETSAGHNVPAIKIEDITEKPFLQIEQDLNTLLEENIPEYSIILPDHPAQLSRLNDWVKTLPERGYVLAPLSALAKK